MKAWKTLGLSALALTAVFSLAACGGNKKDTGKNDEGKLSVALITDTGGVDDKSFNQSAWEGLQSWGKEEGLTKGTGGYNYFQSGSENDYKTNLNQAVAQKYQLVYGIGFALKNALTDAAKANPNTNFVIIDDVIEGQKNVASATFADQEGGYLAGVAAAKSSKSGKIGFIGGMEGEVIDRFEAGFTKGVLDTNPKAKVNVQYAGSFSESAKGKTLTKAMIADGVDVIYQAAGGVGAGVFSEAIQTNQTMKADDPKKVWIIGVDRDQKKEGEYKDKDGKSSNCTLVSTVKGVGAAVIAINKETADGKFPGGEHQVYGLKNGGVKLVNDNATEDVMKAVEEANQKIIDGKIEVPEKPTKTKA
ncbi:basic membrane protein A [Pilibacter termitis]|uniref:Basic membrane protein A n=1 Tax=Pilibacter termitis TaxID=263852 RepID=A0A1T4MI24_9ENTE|nr:BMP family protein [Pilibacter termitis]SJZ66527.1 basic membrane protein A [Pilibacter termitis]